MKNFFYLCLFAVVFAAGCSKDADDDDSVMGLNGNDDDLIVRVTWEQIGADIDLDLDAPTFASRDFSGDDTVGPGDESYTYNDTAPDGQYEVEVDHFSGTGDVSYTLTIQSADDGRTFRGTVSSANDVDIITFTKNGRSLEF